jgi:hypothetical protein
LKLLRNLTPHFTLPTILEQPESRTVRTFVYVKRIVAMPFEGVDKVHESLVLFSLALRNSMLQGRVQPHYCYAVFIRRFYILLQLW